VIPLLVPIIVTVYVPVDPMQERVDGWDGPRTILMGVKAHVIPEGETDVVRDTVPANPLRTVIEIVEVPVAPARIVALFGLAVREKSVWFAMLTVRDVECDSDPLLPVTVTVNVPMVLPEQLSVEVPEPDKLAGLRPQVSPELDAFEVRDTEPLNPFCADTVIVEVAAPPLVKVILVGLAEILKS